MTWEDRKRIYHEKATGIASSTLDVDFLEEDTIRTACEAAERGSENRFDSLRGRAAAIAAIHEATTRFSRKWHLDARRVTDSAEIILPCKETVFKYTHCIGGELESAKQRIQEGEPIAVSIVHEDGRMIAYAIADMTEHANQANIKILDVDLYSRRNTGLSTSITIENQLFQVGVGHVALKCLLDGLRLAIIVDAANRHSNYIFKSLGFVRKSINSSPCHLRLDPV